MYHIQIKRKVLKIEINTFLTIIFRPDEQDLKIDCMTNNFTILHLEYKIKETYLCLFVLSIGN